MMAADNIFCGDNYQQIMGAVDGAEADKYK